MYRKFLLMCLVLGLIIGVTTPLARAQMVLTTADTVHVEVFNWTADATTQKAPESLFVVVYGPLGDSVFGSIIDTASATVKGPYLRRLGGGATANVYDWAQPVSAIDADKGEGLYRVSIFISSGGAADTNFVAGTYFQLVDNSINTIVPAIDTLSWWLTASLTSYSHTDYANDQDTVWVVSPAADTLGILVFYHVGGNSGGRPDSVKALAKP